MSDAILGQLEAVDAVQQSARSCIRLKLGVDVPLDKVDELLAFARTYRADLETGQLELILELKLRPSS